MNDCVGFIFTDGPLNYLHRLGLKYEKDEAHLEKGFRSFYFHFPQGQSFEIRQVFDESLYVRFFRIEHFEPTAGDTTNMPSSPNTINSLNIQKTFKKRNTVNTEFQIFKKLTPENTQIEILKTFFQIRKPFPFWAIWLKCDNFESIKEIAEPKLVLDWNGQKLIVLSLGPNCFDIVLSEN